MADNDGAMEQAVRRGKSFLMKGSSSSGLSVYEHVTQVLTRILDERTPDAADIFETLSSDAKRERLVCPSPSPRDEAPCVVGLEQAKAWCRIFGKREEEVFDEDLPPLPDAMELPLPNLLEIANYFEQAGVMLDKNEAVRVMMSLKELTQNHPMDHCRFWGKILGTNSNYLVAEVEMTDWEEEEEEEQELGAHDTYEEEEKMEMPEKDGIPEENEEDKNDELPKSKYKAPLSIPKEPYQSGANKYLYFVCSEPGQPWERLPLVRPSDIVSARLIKRLFTGQLNAPVESYPPFAGNEKHLLRAQIARISAATQVSPLGFYHFEEEEEDEEEEQNEIMENPEYEEPEIGEMVESLSSWVHHTQYILPQGRCSWWNPLKHEDEMSEEEDEDSESNHPEPQVAPPLLTPLTEDAELNGHPPWTLRATSSLLPQFALAVVTSNLWPGAYTFSIGGLKTSTWVGGTSTRASRSAQRFLQHRRKSTRLAWMSPRC
uniref:radial spoke head protein 4 homolog A-like isoform X2 n=1 Tax=Myxine glutinosa TaxID=7769 RepID=UPI00358F88D9